MKRRPPPHVLRSLAVKMGHGGKDKAGCPQIPRPAFLPWGDNHCDVSVF